MSIKRDKSVELPQRQTEHVSCTARPCQARNRITLLPIQLEGHTLGKLVEEELVLLELLLLGQIRIDRLGLREAGRQLKDGLVGAGEGVALLTEEDVYTVRTLSLTSCLIPRPSSSLYRPEAPRQSLTLTIVDPVLGQRERLSQSPVLVRLGKQPGGIHKVLAAEEARNLLVPQRNIPGAIVNDGTELGVVLEVVHQVFEAVNAVDEVDDALFVGFLVEGLPDVVDRLGEDGGETDTHGGLQCQLWVPALTGKVQTAQRWRQEGCERTREHLGRT